jgi:WD40 repeat protein/predicted Ser/Thr protein kinase
MSHPTPLPEDQTIGYVPTDAAAPTGPSTVDPGQTLPVNDSQLGLQGRFSAFKARAAVASTMGTSIVTPSGIHVPAEALIGPYEVLDELGKGGMGVVYRARHVHLNRIAALKMILGGMHVGPEHLARFRSEAEAVAKLDHPNCVRVYDVGVHNGNPYIALELIEGGSLQQKAAGKPQNAKYAAQTVESVARAVHAAHLKGIVHRDLKPANVLLTLDGQPKVTDFGLAKDLDEGDSGQTNAGSILGTPSYMAPEQAAGRILDIGPTTDVYALGAILYELLIGHPPFRGETAIATIRLVLDGEVVPPRTALPNVPRDLDTICLKALQKPSHRRYESAAAMAEDLRRYLDGEPISARPIGKSERLVKWVRRKPARAASFGTAAVAALAMVALGVWSYFAVTKRAHEAEVAKGIADEALTESTRRLVRLNVANGTRLMEDQDYLGSVLWYAEALRLEGGGPARERMHRTRLAAVLARCPKLTQYWLHDAAVTCGGFDATGRLALTAGDDGIARVWDADTGKPNGPPLEHGAAIKYALLGPDGAHAVTAGADGMMKVWEVATGKATYVANLSVQYTGLAMARDGKTVAVCGAAGRTRVWEFPSGKDVSRMTSAFTDRTTGLAFAPDGQTYVVGSQDNTARVYQTASSDPVTPPLRHAGSVLAVAVSGDGKSVATASADGTAMVWDAASGVPLLPAPLRHGDEVTAIAFDPAGKSVVTGSRDRTAQAWDLETGRALGRPSVHASAITEVAFNPDGQWFVTASDDNSCRVWDVATGAPVSPPLRGNATPTSVSFSPNGRQILVTAVNRIAVLWDVTDATAAPANPGRDSAAPAAAGEITTVTGAKGTLSVAFGGGQAVRVRRVSDHEPVTPPLRTTAPVTAAAFDADGARLAMGDAEGGVMLWDATDGKALWAAPARHSSRVHDLAFSPDGTVLATGSDDNTVGLWDVRSGDAVVPAIRLGASARSVTFGPNGRTLTTLTADGLRRVWDAATGEPLTPPAADTDDGDLPSDDAAVDFLRSLGRVLSSTTVSESGGLVAFDAVPRKAEWQKLLAAAPHRFKPSPAAVTDWHERHAAAAEREGHWFAAAWHLDQLLTADRADAELPRRRAAVASELADWKRAVADATKLIRLKPTSPVGWYQRARARSQLREWGLASADFAAAVALTQDPAFAVGLPALVAADADDAPAYGKACADLWASRGDLRDDTATLRLALALAVRPDSGIPPPDVLTLVTPLAAKRPNDAFATCVYGLSQFRAGRLDEAEHTLAPLCLDKAKDHPVAWAVVAGVHAKRAKPAEAKVWRDRAQVWRATADPATPAAWDVRAVVGCLVRE